MREAAPVVERVKEYDEILATTAYEVAMKRLRDHQAAEEVAQDTMVAYKARHEPPDNPEAWVTRVATNLTTNEWRRRRRERSLMERIAAVGWTVYATPEDDAFLARFVLQEAIDSLSRRQREAVTYVLVDGMDRSAAASKMGIGLEALKTHLKRGRANLRALFAESDANGE